MTTLAEIAAQLEEPFAISDIDLLPKGKSEHDGKTMCMGLPYADVRVYEDRLNKLAPGEWSTPPPLAIVVGQKLVVYVSVTVCGVTHTDVGEAAAGGENAATESWAQAFKRACSQFGLGRYLYSLNKVWVPYNAQRKIIDLNEAGIQAIVRRMYSEAHITGSHPAQSVQTLSSTPQQSVDPVQPTPGQSIAHAPATAEQINSMHKLYEHLAQSVPADVTGLDYLAAKGRIQALTAEYRAMKQKVGLSKPTPIVQYIPLADVDAIRTEWARVCMIKAADVERRWKSFKTYINNGSALTDEEFTTALRDAAQAYISQQATKAS